MDVFCERCGTLQPQPEAAASRSAGVLARRMLDAVGIIEVRPEPGEDWLRLCLSCRGYSCPNCWNQEAGACQTCAPLPEPVILEPVVEPVAELPEPIEFPVPKPMPYWVTQLDPLVAVGAADAVPEPEPEVAAEQEPEPAAAESDTEPEPVAAQPAPLPDEPLPVERPAPPRMPVLPLPPPRPADAPVMPLPALPDYPIAPQIAFNAQPSFGGSTATAAPAWDAHMLIAPPRALPAAAVASGLRLCSSCQLTLSARAHFCRRCGSQQPL